MIPVKVPVEIAEISPTLFNTLQTVVATGMGPYDAVRLWPEDKFAANPTKQDGSFYIGGVGVVGTALTIGTPFLSLKDPDRPYLEFSPPEARVGYGELLGSIGFVNRHAVQSKVPAAGLASTSSALTEIVYIDAGHSGFDYPLAFTYPRLYSHYDDIGGEIKIFVKSSRGWYGDVEGARLPAMSLHAWDDYGDNRGFTGVMGSLLVDQLTISNNSTLRYPIDRPLLYVQSELDVVANFTSNTASSSGGQVIIRSKGNGFSPSGYTNTGDWIGFLGFRGYDGTNFLDGSSAALIVKATNNFLGGATRGSEFVFESTPTGSAARAAWVKFTTSTLGSSLGMIHGLGDLLIDGNLNANGLITGSIYYDNSTDVGMLATAGVDRVDEALHAIDSIMYGSRGPTGTSMTSYKTPVESAISWDNGTMTLTHAPIAPATTIDVYFWGKRYTKSGAQTATITDTEGIWFFYYNSAGTLVATQTEWVLNPPDSVPIATVYWDATNNLAITFAEERHGLTMDPGTHRYLHETVGTRYESGLTLADYTLSSSGVITASLTDGEIHDEDIEIEITHAAVPGTNQFEQVLRTANKALIPIYYRSGASGVWRKIAANASGYLVDGPGANNRHFYNQFTGGAWQETQVGSGSLSAMWMFATDNISEPIILIMGQRTDGTLANARLNNTYESLAFGPILFKEFKVIYRLIFSATGATAWPNPVQLMDVTDYRSVSNLPSGTYVATAHSILTGLDYASAGHTGFVELQASTPGTAQTGHVNISGTMFCGAGLIGDTAGVNFPAEDPTLYVSSDATNMQACFTSDFNTPNGAQFTLRSRGSGFGTDHSMAGNWIGFIGFRGHDGGDFTLGSVAAYIVKASESYLGGAALGAYHTWEGTPTGSTTRAEWMRLKDNHLAIGGDVSTTMPLTLYARAGPVYGGVNVVGIEDVATVGLSLNSYGIGAGGPIPYSIISIGARGTRASPTAIKSGDPIAYFIGRGRKATVYSGDQAYFTFAAAEDWTDAAAGTAWGLTTTEAGTTTNYTRLYVDGHGRLNHGNFFSSASLLYHQVTNTSGDGGIVLQQNCATVDASDLVFRKGRNTFASPTVITTADELGTIQFAGYGGAAGYIVGAAIKGISSGTIADSRVPGQLEFWTGTNAAPSVLTKRAFIDNAGLFDIATKFQVDANGDIIKLRNVTTTFPSSNSAGVLTNNGSGTLTWEASGGAWGTLSVIKETVFAGITPTSYTTGNTYTIDGCDYLCTIAGNGAADMVAAGLRLERGTTSGASPTKMVITNGGANSTFSSLVGGIRGRLGQYAVWVRMASYDFAATQSGNSWGGMFISNAYPKWGFQLRTRARALNGCPNTTTGGIAFDHWLYGADLNPTSYPGVSTADVLCAFVRSPNEVEVYYGTYSAGWPTIESMSYMGRASYGTGTPWLGAATSTFMNDAMDIAFELGGAAAAFGGDGLIKMTFDRWRITKWD